jgi:uncharacterized protein (TIGR00255 family)
MAMIRSMTGFGKATHQDASFTVVAEVRSLNSKFLDLSIRVPRRYSSRELELRALLQDSLERGKVTLSIEAEERQPRPAKVNEALFVAYYQELKKMADRVMAPYDELFGLAWNAPSVVEGMTEELPEEEWARVLGTVNEALAQCTEFREREGNVLAAKIKSYITAISESLAGVEQLDPARVERIRNRIKGNLIAFVGEQGLDANRLEQEIIFYIEKLDIHEEKVRLQAHLDHFLHALGHGKSAGKRLGFIAQEIGREINTIGSKANDADIQKQVVRMKEELEKIKEQLNNIL